MADEQIIVEAMPSVPTPIDEIARQQIRQWLRSTGTTQVSFAEQIDRNQECVSRYLNGNFDADLPTLERMAGVFGHNLATLFGSLPSDPDEAVLLRIFRGLLPGARKALLTLLRQWPPARPDRDRTKTPR